MVNIIADKYISTPVVGKNFAYTSSVPLQKEISENEHKIHKPLNTISDKQQKYISGGLITGGAILLYYGLTRPGKAKVFDRFIRNRIFDMETIANRFRIFVLNTITSSFEETATHIQKFEKTRFLNPADSVIQINMLTNPEKIANAQDLAFDAILNTNRSRRKSGTSEFGYFDTKFSNIMRRVTDEIDAEKHRTTIELDDYLHLPKAKEKYSPNQVEEAESHLVNANRSLDMYMTDLIKFRLEAVKKQQYTQMTDALVHARKMQTITKQTIINSSFERVKKLLGLPKDFIPLYDKDMYELGSMEEISKYLAPQKIPARIRKQTEYNVYMETLTHVDLRNLNEEQLKNLFFRTPYENNLKDLKYLIDRYRLRHAIAKVQQTKDLPIYEGIVVKLEYLSNRLNEFGKDLLLSRCDKDIVNMSVDQRKSTLYYISTVAKRLGYESLEVMDADLYKTSSAYKNFNLHSYMPIFKENPEIYFVE